MEKLPLLYRDTITLPQPAMEVRYQRLHQRPDRVVSIYGQTRLAEKDQVPRIGLLAYPMGMSSLLQSRVWGRGEESLEEPKTRTTKLYHATS